MNVRYTEDRGFFTVEGETTTKETPITIEEAAALLLKKVGIEVTFNETEASLVRKVTSLAVERPDYSKFEADTVSKLWKGMRALATYELSTTEIAGKRITYIKEFRYQKDVFNEWFLNHYIRTTCFMGIPSGDDNLGRPTLSCLETLRRYQAC